MNSENVDEMPASSQVNKLTVSQLAELLSKYPHVTREMHDGERWAVEAAMIPCPAGVGETREAAMRQLWGYKFRFFSGLLEAGEDISDWLPVSGWG